MLLFFSEPARVSLHGVLHHRADTGATSEQMWMSLTDVLLSDFKLGDSVAVPEARELFSTQGKTSLPTEVLSQKPYLSVPTSK